MRVRITPGAVDLRNRSSTIRAKHAVAGVTAARPTAKRRSFLLMPYCPPRPWPCTVARCEWRRLGRATAARDRHLGRGFSGGPLLWASFTSTEAVGPMSDRP